MKRIQIFAAILLLAGTAKAQSAIDEARKQIVNENYNAARKGLTDYISAEKDPAKQAQAYFWLGETYYQDLIAENPIKAMESAREQYNKGLALDKGNSYCQVGMGKLLLDAKNIKEAQKTFDSAVRNSKEKPYREFGSPQIQMLIGDSWLNGLNKNAEQAVNYYTRARDIDPSKAVYLIRMGDGNLAKGDAGAAMTAYESASSKDPRNPEVYLKRAVIWHRAGKIDLAIKECEDGKKADATYAPIYKMLAELHYANKDYNKVTGDLDEYLKVVGDPTKDPDAWLRFIKFLTYQAKDYTRAIDESKKFSAKFRSFLG